MASSSAQFVSITPMGSAFTLSGAKAVNPLDAGDTICAHGTFEGGEETGAAFFTIVRKKEKSRYVIAPLGSVDLYWGDHLSKQLQVDAKLMQAVNEKPRNGEELLRRWRVIGTSTTEVDPKEFSVIGKKGMETALRTLTFLQENVVADKRPPPEVIKNPPQTRNGYGKLMKGGQY